MGKVVEFYGNEIVRYVAGFAFCEHFENVLLIRKIKPDWMRGKLNGIGGKIEPGETPLQAMVREFREECALPTITDDWTEFAQYCGNAAHVRFYYANLPLLMLKGFRTTTDEAVVLVNSASAMKSGSIIPNLRWLLPLATLAHSALHETKNQLIGQFS